MSEYAAEVFDPRVVFVEIEEVDVARTIVTADILRVNCLTGVIKVTEKVDEKVEGLLDSRNADRIYWILNVILSS